MRKLLFFLSFFLVFSISYAQNKDTVPVSYFVTHDKTEFLQKLADLPCGINTTDPIKVIIEKLSKFLESYVPNQEYPDDYYARESNLQALKSVKEGGYGIGAVLIDQDGKIISKAYNSQIQRHRSDLHGEMTLLSNFEESPAAKKYMNIYIYKPGITVFSSAEPCPMCFIRLASAGVDTRYCTPGPDDGMVTRVHCLPQSWQTLAAKHKFEKGKCSPVMQKISHLLFYSYLLDNRGPK
jgi:tRNA(Arg) A34 adenosine deaminase TadA